VSPPASGGGGEDAGEGPVFGAIRDVTDDLLAPGGKVDQQTLHEYYASSADDDETPIAVRFRLQRDLDKRLDRYLVDRVPFFSRTSIQRLIRERAVTVNGRVPKASTRLKLGDEIIAILPPPPSTDLPAEEIPLEALHEDDSIIVVNKADDIIVHPARGKLSGTMINGLAWRFQHYSGGELSSVGEEFARPGVVHRLDRHTTGAIVFAKTDTAHWRIGKQFELRTTEKRYLAIVHGRMEPFADLIDVPLGKHPTVRTKYAVRWDETGKSSQTIYRVRELYDAHSLVELELKTGRTHQIRVHLSHLGYPIVGDDIYGGRHLFAGELGGARGIPALGLGPRDPLITRQALHAALLGFDHPMSGERMEFQAPVPADMRRLVAALRATSEHASRPGVSGTRLDLERVFPADA
jgi:23S rRNA pseudouridine1911/1915/1917 synthase